MHAGAQHAILSRRFHMGTCCKENACNNFTKPLRSLFSEFKVLFSRRTCNRVAHYVAAFGCKCPRDTLLCWEGMPNGLEDLVANNLAESIS